LPVLRFVLGLPLPVLPSSASAGVLLDLDKAQAATGRAFVLRKHKAAFTFEVTQLS
jgi:hypothetical protein